MRPSAVRPSAVRRPPAALRALPLALGSALAALLRPAARGAARARRVLRAVVGAPDYERYVAHCRARHPDAPVLDRAAFERERLAARYNRPGSRCC